MSILQRLPDTVPGAVRTRPRTGRDLESGRVEQARRAALVVPLLLSENEQTFSKEKVWGLGKAGLLPLPAFPG